ncbi:MAG: glycoside hydrolase family 44 protein [Anaerolineales bacterium]
MNKNKFFWFFVIVAILAGGIFSINAVHASPAAATIPVSFIVDTEHARSAISPYIYGSNQDIAGVSAWTLRRFGGNRTTGFNWENNASNAGSDYNQSSDSFVCTWVGLDATGCNTPGAALAAYHDKSLSTGAMDIITLQMAGYVAADKNGTVATTEAAPSARWIPVTYAKGSAFANPPVATDNAVYSDEEINFLVQKYGLSSTANGVKAYALDNEPALWSSTHPLLHPAQPGAAEIVTRSTALSSAVKAVDPSALIFGPAAYGFYEMYAMQDAPDWPSLKGSYSWYVDYYLAQMKAASDAKGKRLLDAYDFHWYPEAQGAGTRIVFGGSPGTLDVQKARVQAPRSLWDPTYAESSWIEDSFPAYLPILPRVKQSINTYYPGTKLAITEFSYGGEADISGGLATADVLGVFGKYGVDYATFWQLETTSPYVASAYNLYRNYDGNNSKFGDTKIDTDNSDIADSSMYAAITGTDTSKVDIIVMNKNFDSDLTGSFKVYSPVNYASGQVWGYDSASSAITQRTAITGITGNTFTYTIPARTVYHIVLTAGTTSVTNTPRPPTATATSTATPTASYTPCYGCGFKLQYQAGDASATTNQITPHFNLFNNSSAAVPLTEFKIRYWYTEDGNKAQTYSCDYAIVGCANTTGTFVKMSSPTSSADNYLEVGFTAAAGSIAAGGQTGVIQIRLNKSDFSNYTQTGDYSFDATKTAYADWDHVAVYHNNDLVWGIEPGMGPTPTSGPSNTPTLTLVRTLTPTPTRTLTPLATTLTPTRTLTLAITLTPTRTFTAGVTLTPTRTNTAGPTFTRTVTPAISLTPTRTSTTGPTLTPTITPTVGGACSPVTSTITAPFTYDGAGVFCWQSSNLGTYINSWNVTSLTVNGVNFTNVYTAAGSLPAKINGYWYVSYNSAVSYGHFETK